MKSKPVIHAICLLLFSGLLLVNVRADVTPHALFCDHAVLQQGLPVPIWGTADACESVSVSLAGQQASAQAGSDGRWTVKLPEMKAGGPHALVISGNNRVELKDVWIGEVWICSGQSNMERQLGPRSGQQPLVNNGSKLSPGDEGSIGKATVSGNLTITSGSLAIDIGGTSVSNAWQGTAGSCKFDQLAVTGNVVLSGTLNVSLISSFAPASANTFNILTGSGGLSSAFTNVTGGRVSTTTGAGSFAVTYTATQVVLSDYQATPIQLMALPEIDSFEDPTDAKAALLSHVLGAGASPNAHLPPVIERLGDRLAIRFTRHQADVSYIVEASSDLQNWEIIEQDPGNIGEEVTVTDTVDISATKPPQRFMRIRVVQP